MANLYPIVYEEPTEVSPILSSSTLVGPIGGYWHINAAAISTPATNVDITRYTILNTAIPEKSDVWGAATKGGSSNTAVSMSIALIVVDN